MPNQTYSESIHERMLKLEAIIKQLTASLPKEIKHFEISSISKTPSKVVSLREVLLYRITELSSATFELIKSEKPIAAVILARAQFETIVLWLFLLDKIEKICERNALHDNFDSEIMRLLFGGKIDNSPEQAYNILTIMDKMSNEYPKLRELYNKLSEFAHPNHIGTHGYYARIDESNFSEILGPNDIESIIEITLISLTGLLELYILSYNESTNFLPKFIEICESNIKE